MLENITKGMHFEKMFGVILGIVTSFAYVSCDITTTGLNPRVAIPGLGTVIGETMHFNVTEYPDLTADVDVYRGIPFALPPVGELRFAKPVASVPWDGEYNATYFRNICMQPGWEESREMQSEDCLYLNIWVPSFKPQNATVMFWIHGGAFALGKGSSYSYNGIPITAINNIIFVTTNYRLNSFGFLSLGDDVMPGNFGLWDQLMALKWTKEHISAFGGNGDDITIFGQSAGAASVGLHLVSPHSWDYFTKATMQSGCAISPWAVEYDIEKVRQDAYGVAELVGCGEDYANSHQLMSCLRDVPASNLSVATNNWLVRTVTTVIPFVPVVDGDFIPDDPWTLLKRGQFKQCDILLGSTQDDGSIFSVMAYPGQVPRFFPTSNYEEFRDTLNEFIYTYRNNLILDSIEQQYVDWTTADDPDANYFYTYMMIITDEAFACPADGTARAHINSGRTVYMYQMTHLPTESIWPPIPRWKGVAHGDDMQFVFGYHFIPEEEHEMAPNELDMIIQIMKYWTNFAKTGNPNLENISDEEEATPTTWKPYIAPDLHYKNLHPDFLNGQALKTDSCHFWNDYLPKMVTFTADLKQTEKEWREEFSRWKYEDMPNWKNAFEDYKNMNMH